MILKECLKYVNYFIKQYEENPKQFDLEILNPKIHCKDVSEFIVKHQVHKIVKIIHNFSFAQQSVYFDFYFENYNFCHVKDKNINEICTVNNVVILECKSSGVFSNNLNRQKVKNLINKLKEQNITSINDITEEVEFYLKLKEII